MDSCIFPEFGVKCQPDLVVVFTNTCSHKMVNSVNQKSRKHDIPVARIHNASASALKSVLEQYCG